MKINNSSFFIACVLCFMAFALPIASHAQKATPLVIQGGTLIDATGRAPMLLVGNTGYNYSAFFADASIKNSTDLKGKKVGSGEPGSTPDQLTRLALRKLGIDPEKDVTLVHFDEGLRPTVIAWPLKKRRLEVWTGQRLG